MAARLAAESVAADGKWRTAQEKRERAQQNRKGLGAQRQRMRSSKSEEHIARSEQLRRAQSDSLVTGPARPPRLSPPPPPPCQCSRLPEGCLAEGRPAALAIWLARRSHGRGRLTERL